MKEMKTEVKKTEDKTVVKAAGRLDCNAAAELGEILFDIYDETDELIMDLEELTYISESGLRLLLSAYEIMWMKGGSLKVSGCTSQVEERLRLTELEEYLLYTESEKIYVSGYDYEELKKETERRLSDLRFQHSLRVSENAYRIAERFGLDAEKARIAGLLHDIAKEFPEENFLEIAEAHGIAISGSERKAPHKLHGKVGAVVAREELGIEDDDILSGISHHYGYTQMTDFEEAIFIADIFDKTDRLGYSPSMDELLAVKNLDDAIIHMLGYALKYQSDAEKRFGSEVFMIYDYVMNKRIRGEKMGRGFQEFLKKRPLKYGDELFDKMFDVYAGSITGMSSVKNMRDLGGYHTYDGRCVKKGKLIRSAALNDLSKEDADRLKKMGISHIIDLRGKTDRMAMPDVNVEGFIVVSCEMSSIKLRDYQRELVSEFAGLGAERAFGQIWLNSEFLRGFDVEKMYRDSIKMSDSVSNIREMLKILIGDDCTGVVIHCRDGKDRTGIAVIVILMALGVYDEDVMADYMASAVKNYSTTEICDDYFSFHKFDEEVIRNSRREKSVDYELIMSVIDWFRQEFGNMDRYLHTVLKLDDDFIDCFRDKFLTESV